MRTTVDLDPQLLRELKRLARERGKPVKALLNESLRCFLRDSGRREGPESYVCPVFEMGEPRRNLDKALVLAGELEDEEVVREMGLRK